jgi:secreted Zn-dependent insulinase-like peptidase
MISLRFGQAQEPNDIPELFLPGPNAFIPTNLDVEKIPVVEVRVYQNSDVHPLTHALDSRQKSPCIYGIRR